MKLKYNHFSLDSFSRRKVVKHTLKIDNVLCIIYSGLEEYVHMYFVYASLDLLQIIKAMVFSLWFNFIC